MLIGYSRFVENSMGHLVSVVHKRGVLELNKNYVRLILGLLYALISMALMSIKSLVNLI